MNKKKQQQQQNDFESIFGGKMNITIIITEIYQHTHTHTHRISIVML